jgi:hypothetical protein
MKAILKATCALGVLLAALDVGAAGDLVSNATITKISLRGVAGELMRIDVTGGSGLCANADITFPTTANVDQDNRMVSLATAAYLAGKKVRVYDYGGTIACTAADFIAISD